MITTNPNLNNNLATSSTALTTVGQERPATKRRTLHDVHELFEVTVLTNIIADYIYVNSAEVDRTFVTPIRKLGQYSSSYYLTCQFAKVIEIVESLGGLSFVISNTHDKFIDRPLHIANVVYEVEWGNGGYEASPGKTNTIIDLCQNQRAFNSMAKKCYDLMINLKKDQQLTSIIKYSHQDIQVHSHYVRLREYK